MSHVNKLRQAIREIVEEELDEINSTANVGGYNTPGAFSDDEEDEGTDITGANGGKIKTKEGGARSRNAEVFDYKLVENRWLALKKDDSRSAVQKIGYGMRTIKKQLKEIEDFTRWYKRLQLENDVESASFWKRTNRDFVKVNERIARIVKNIQEISQ